MPADGGWAVIVFASAGPPASQSGEPGQVRKEAATAIDYECRGQARHFLFREPLPGCLRRFCRVFRHSGGCRLYPVTFLIVRYGRLPCTGMRPDACG